MSVMAPIPSAESQLVFLAKLQRLFAEGDFTATYKFALLISLADLAVELGEDDGSELIISNRKIAERFIQLYWQHAAPYGIGRPGLSVGVLVQNVGSQAAVLSAIADFRAGAGVTTHQQARALTAYGLLVSQVAATVSAHPLKYLQNFGGGTDPFIYERDNRGSVRLKAGVAYCLRRFYPLVQQLSRAHWIEHIKSNRRNHGVLGDAGDLEDFLFSTSRQSLAIIGAGLRKLDGCRCFYCGNELNDADVDHFMPFSLYPRDLAHNFVIAHSACNRSKSATLAARPHLERWLERLQKNAADLTDIGVTAGVVADVATTKRVAAWGYSNSHASGGYAWLAATQYELVDDGYLNHIRDLIL